MKVNDAKKNNNHPRNIQYHYPEPDQHSYKNLIVWQKAMDFSVHVIDLVDELTTDRRHYRLIEQLEAAVTSVPMNIAEGKGKYTNKDYANYLVTARGSLYETMTLLEIFMRKKWITLEQFSQIEKESIEISKILTSMHFNLRREG